MEPADFIRKWEKSTLKESAAAQQHFLDLCELLDEPKPADVDAIGDNFCFEKGATKSTGGNGFADVWKKACFGWEYKGPHKDLDRAHDQLLRYSVALENPPLLIVSDTKKIIIRTNWTNTIQEKHEIALTDLVDAGKRDLLKAAFSNPESLKPKRTRTQLTAEAADEFSELAQRLRSRRLKTEDEQEYAKKVAHFVNRLVFCMFAEDVGLLPNKMFQKAMEMAERAPNKAQGFLQQLFAAMKDGGAVGFEEIPWFNGGLFDSDEALPMDRDDVALALKAAKLDWQDIDPSILGTLFERGLDPSKRSQLGAHYTDRDKIMMIVNPVIVEPLTKEWEEAKAAIEAELAKSAKAKSKSAKTKAEKRAEKVHIDFIEKLKKFRVLDPACGSGNFLYLSLLSLKDLEHKANLDAETLGLQPAFPQVGPEAVKGIEINPYAAELARVSIWIGEIQWMRRNGFSAQTNPILRPLGNIECRDALIKQAPENGEWLEAEWPDSDVIVGNPPFLGGKMLIRNLSEEYCSSLFTTYRSKVPPEADLVTYWFFKCSTKLKKNRHLRCGLVATNSIRGKVNRTVLEPIVETGAIYRAWGDEPWVVDGAAVRVSLICFAGDEIHGLPIRLDGDYVSKIFSDLSASLEDHSIDLTKSRKLYSNKSIAFQGVTKAGSFDILGATAREWLRYPTNPNGSSNRQVLKRYYNARDLVQRANDTWIIDFTNLRKEEAEFYEAPFAYVKNTVHVERSKNRRSKYKEIWWQFAEARPGLFRSIAGFNRYLATPLVSKHRIFAWLSSADIAANLLVVIARNDDTSFGILHSKYHEAWSLRMCTWLGVGNDPRYTPTTCFETFPFPEGLTPNIPAANYADDPRAVRIAEAAARLNELRENWLNPPDLVKRVPEVVEGYPDRILPVDETAEKTLKKRTLTNLYNERPAWLDNAHRALDEAVAAAYGWEDDFKSGELTDEEILKRLFELNQKRAKAQDKPGK